MTLIDSSSNLLIMTLANFFAGEIL